METLPCTGSDLKLLNDELKAHNRNSLIGAVFILVIALVMPWLGSSRTHGKAMVDYMPYPLAVLYIILVFTPVLIVTWFLVVPKLKRDLAKGVKVVYQSCIKKKEEYQYRKLKNRSIILNDMPAGVKHIFVTPKEFTEFTENDEVKVEYFPNTKKIIRITKL